jgi:tankyrase
MYVSGITYHDLRGEPLVQGCLSSTHYLCPHRVFRLPICGCTLLPGIYFAHDSSKSNQYVYGISSRGCTAHSERSCYECERVLLLCRVLLGKSHKQTSAQRLSHAPPGHNSVSGVPTEGGLCYKEYVIYRGEQAYPEYLISYKIVAPDGKD